MCFEGRLRDSKTVAAVLGYKARLSGELKDFRTL